MSSTSDEDDFDVDEAKMPSNEQMEVLLAALPIRSGNEKIDRKRAFMLSLKEGDDRTEYLALWQAEDRMSQSVDGDVDEEEGEDDSHPTSVSNVPSVLNTPPSTSNVALASIAQLQLFCSCEPYYVEKGNCKMALFAMAIGIDDAPDLSAEPFKSSNQKLKFTPKAVTLTAEIARRAFVLNIKKPKCANWKITAKQDWLVKYPITNPADVEFVKRECALYISLLQNAADEKSRQAVASSLNWAGNNPYLRLYHCLIEDDIKEAYVNRDDVMTRQQLDGRRSEERRVGKECDTGCRSRWSPYH